MEMIRSSETLLTICKTTRPPLVLILSRLNQFYNFTPFLRIHFNIIVYVFFSSDFFRNDIRLWWQRQDGWLSRYQDRLWTRVSVRPTCCLRCELWHRPTLVHDRHFTVENKCSLWSSHHWLQICTIKWLIIIYVIVCWKYNFLTSSAFRNPFNIFLYRPTFNIVLRYFCWA